MSSTLRSLPSENAYLSRLNPAGRCHRQDGHPVVGGSASCRGLYVATMHSGMTLAPEVARLVAAELRHWDVTRGLAVGSAPELLEAQTKLRPYRLERDFEAGALKAAYSWK
jgi:hypothetical protein